jgi:hypothetical protein
VAGSTFATASDIGDALGAGVAETGNLGIAGNFVESAATKLHA